MQVGGVGFGVGGGGSFAISGCKQKRDFRACGLQTKLGFSIYGAEFMAPSSVAPTHSNYIGFRVMGLHHGTFLLSVFSGLAFKILSPKALYA